MTCRLTYFLSHPIQYQSPLLRRIAQEAGLSFRVIYEKDFSSQAYFDPGFQVDVEWDVPLREGYKSDILADVSLDDVLRQSDVVWLHGWDSKSMRRVLRRAFTLRKPILMRGENWYGAMPDGQGVVGMLRRAYHKSIFRRCSAFLSIGTKNTDYYLGHGILPEYIFSMPYAVDNAAFKKPSSQDEVLKLRRSVDLAEGQKLILYAGKLQRRKNPALLLEAVEQLQQGRENGTKLVIVGDGEMRKSLEASAPPGTVFTGFKNQSELPVYYAAADVFVLPSEREPWGLAINEAMAAGTAVVATDQCGAAYDLINNDTGRTAPAGDVNALVSAIADVLENSTDMGRAARARIASWDFEADVLGLKAALEATS